MNEEMCAAHFLLECFPHGSGVALSWSRHFAYRALHRTEWYLMGGRGRTCKGGGAWHTAQHSTARRPGISTITTATDNKSCNSVQMALAGESREALIPRQARYPFRDFESTL